MGRSKRRVALPPCKRGGLVTDTRQTRGSEHQKCRERQGQGCPLSHLTSLSQITLDIPQP